MTITDRKIIFVLSTIIVILVSTSLNTYQDLNIQVSYVNGQEFTSEANNNSSISTITNNSAMNTQSMLQSFTISCTDFMKLFDTISALDIGDQVSEKKVNQTTLDDIEQIFNSYAGNCSQLDEYEFD
jgi:hypothetical protein